MNKQTFSIELSFDVDAGTIELLDDDKWCVNQLIPPQRYSLSVIEITNSI